MLSTGFDFDSDFEGELAVLSDFLDLSEGSEDFGDVLFSEPLLSVL